MKRRVTRMAAFIDKRLRPLARDANLDEALFSAVSFAEV
jgi:hypothetical protein